MMDVKPVNNQIIHIASAVSEADDNSIPALLLQVKDVLASQPAGDRKRFEIVNELWHYDIPVMIVTVLKQDFTFIPGAWLTACQLCSIMVDCCVDYTINISYLKKEVLPDLTYTILQLLSKIINEYYKVDKLFKANLCSNFSWLVTTITKLMEKFVFTSITVTSSKHFMQFLMTEDSKLSLVSLALLKNIFKLNRDIFYHVAESRTHSIADELTYKITSTTEGNIARISISVLLTMMEIHSPLLQLFSSKRYRGFKTYLNKWKDKGFNDDIQRLINVLDTQTDQQLDQKFSNAAVIIQSVYRGHLWRRQFKKASVAIGKFQQIYRQKKNDKEIEKERENFETIKSQYLESKRRKTFVNSKSKQLKVIESIPARTVNTFLENLQHESAKKIQAAWLGAKTRKIMQTWAPEMRKEKAVVVIQRQVRKWLKLIQQRRTTALTDLLPAGLTDKRKVELQNVVAKIRERFPNDSVNDEELSTSHEKAFRMLNSHFGNLRQLRRRDEHRKALLAQLYIQSEQFNMFVPQLRNVTREHIEQFTSRSAPVIVAARQQHIDNVNEHKKQ